MKTPLNILITLIEMLTKIDRSGFMFILSSPSGAGKTTVSRQLLAMDERLEMSVSATTRPIRPGEVEGSDYYFISDDTFREMVANGSFLEHAHVFGKSYGTPRDKVEDALSRGRDVLFDIDWQGTAQLTARAKENVISIFILPPDMHELERRLRSRGQDSDEIVRTRMAKAAEEISHWKEYDYVVVNRSIETCVAEVHAILTAERVKRTRQYGLETFVNHLLNK
jgi:guanylate kinase